MVVLPAPRKSATDPQPSPAFSLLDKVISLMSALTMLSTSHSIPPYAGRLETRGDLGPSARSPRQAAEPSGT